MLLHFGLVLLIFVGLVLFYGIIVLHDIPYEIAKERDHPHQDAIHVAGWVSLFTLHAIWPFLWIWATLYKKDAGWGIKDTRELQNRIQDLQKQVDELDQTVQDLQVQKVMIAEEFETAELEVLSSLADEGPTDEEPS